MKTDIICKNCHTPTGFELYCDECEKRLDREGFLICEVGKHSIIEMIRDDTTYHFCNYLCLLDFTLKEIKKER